MADELWREWVASRAEKIARLSARLDEASQEKVAFLLGIGYGPTDLIREGIDLLYQKAMRTNAPSIPALLKTLSELSGEGPSNLSVNRKKYYKELLIEKRFG